MFTRTYAVSRGLVQLYAPSFLKRIAWDREFSRGRWTCLDRPIGECRHPEVERYARGGAVLDMGCGPGSTGHELEPGSYIHYTGVDISQVAIDIARGRLLREPAPHTYEQGDMLTYVPKGSFDVILFGDSIYYVALSQIPGMLRRYTNYLKPTGSIVVRVCDPEERYQPLLGLIRERLPIVESSRHISAEGIPVEIVVCH